MTKTIGPNLVKLSTDKWAKSKGLLWEARFNHPVLGLVVYPCHTRAEALEQKLLVVGQNA
jgi:hypothetical protein